MLSRGGTKKRRELFRLVAEGLSEGPFETFARARGKLLRGGLGQRLRVFVSGLAEKANLLPIATAPTTEQQVKAQSKPLRRWQRMVHGLGLKPAGLATIRRKHTGLVPHGGRQLFQQFHFNFQRVAT